MELIGGIITVMTRLFAPGSRGAVGAVSRAAKMRVRSNVKRERARRFYERLGYAVTKSQHIFDKTL